MTGYVLVAVAFAAAVGVVPLLGCRALDRLQGFHVAGRCRLARHRRRRAAVAPVTSPDAALEQERQHARLVEGLGA